jgi:hypothetical protein
VSKQTTTTERENQMKKPNEGFDETLKAVAATMSRQAGEIFPKLPGYENKHSISSNHICTLLLCTRPKHASR